jgi:hypothetical protein
VPELKPIPETDFYTLMEHIFMLPEVKTVVADLVERYAKDE